ncbi:DUF547 domain-containing protein [Ferruginibacter yonginensis]|uniref:DUF547 domain-containing protein n=1 Tax=Ferruginibacter yonginensis TaxID=1310416 RepID=A0ABV8QNJ4_9BACT
MKFYLILIVSTVLFSSCLTGVPKGKGNAITHEQWTTLLKKHVNNAGLVDYKGFIKDSAALNKYLAVLSNNAPANDWSKDEKFAYWINAYNAFTVKLIVDNYPVKSIKDLGAANPIIFVNTAWDKKFFSIDGKKMTLNTIEHKILRKKFKDPRMHFAINCASMSCPKLLNEAYEAATLNKQLDQQAKDFLADKSKNEVAAQNPKLSSIFNWFNGDFKKTGKSKIAFINQYTSTKINDNASISYLDYNWSLNEQK